MLISDPGRSPYKGALEEPLTELLKEPYKSFTGLYEVFILGCDGFVRIFVISFAVGTSGPCDLSLVF